MPASRQYKIAASLHLTCSLLDLSPARVLARAGLAADSLETEDAGVDAAAYFKLWTAVAAESGDPDLPLTLGRGASRGPFQPALLAFSSSPDIITGLKRLAVFKPLMAPIELLVSEQPEGLSVTFKGAGPHEIPDVMSSTEIVFFLDFARAFTAHDVIPLSVTLPENIPTTQAYRDFVGADIQTGERAGLTFSLEDAHRPLISADTEFYHLIEKELLSRLKTQTEDAGLSARVSRVLAELLPSGRVSTDFVSARLNLSKRSLQRKLKDEGTSFQAVLDDTRASLAMTYLRDQKLSAEETSHLLAFQDPNSFYRAFHDWTGMTPAQARTSQLN